MQLPCIPFNVFILTKAMKGNGLVGVRGPFAKHLVAIA